MVAVFGLIICVVRTSDNVSVFWLSRQTVTLVSIVYAFVLRVPTCAGYLYVRFHVELCLG